MHNNPYFSNYDASIYLGFMQGQQKMRAPKAVMTSFDTHKIIEWDTAIDKNRNTRKII
jgi:hypothetical protein